MRSALLIAVLIPLLLPAGGCNKRAVKKTSSPSDETASAKAPAPKNDKKADEPNWLSDPRFKKEKGEASLPKEGGPNGKLPASVPIPQGGNPAPPATGVLQPQPQPPANPTAPPPKLDPVTEHNMKDVWIYIENASLASGQMPPPGFTLQALIQAKSPAAELVKNGSIWLTGSNKRESVWAFETRALTQGGFIASQNGVETVTAQQLKAMLGR